MTGTASFGRWRKLRRLALDVTQVELGQLVGCSAMTIRKIEADERRPSRQLAERLAQHLDIAVVDMLRIQYACDRRRVAFGLRPSRRSIDEISNTRNCPDHHHQHSQQNSLSHGTPVASPGGCFIMSVTIACAACG